jgi:DNA-binding GntR family transcriptional regulator
VTTAHDLEEVFALRLLLEVPATRRACELLSTDDLAALDHELTAMSSLAREGDEGAFMAHDKAFHEVILHASGNRRLTTIVSQLRDHVRFRGASTVGRSRDLQAILSEHVVILEALRARDAAAAADAMRAHLLETGRLLLAQESAPVAGLPWADVLGG